MHLLSKALIRGVEVIIITSCSRNESQRLKELLFKTKQLPMKRAFQSLLADLAPNTFSASHEDMATVHTVFNR